MYVLCWSVKQLWLLARVDGKLYLMVSLEQFVAEVAWFIT